MAPFWIALSVAFPVLLVLGLIAMARTFGAAFTNRSPQGFLAGIAWLAMHPIPLTGKDVTDPSIGELVFLMVLNLLIWSLLLAAIVWAVFRVG